ncbi:MAG: hypothetical protein GY698_23695, partial [Actinomycetia bacterium]|nr:hypothetical protein [Actinomycetes bacterium]
LDDSEPEDLFGEESLADNDEDIVEESLFEGGSIEDEELALQDTLSGESGLESVDADTEIGTLEESDADLGDILDESELDELLSQEGEAETEEIGAETDEDLPIIEDDSELEDFEVEGEDVPVEGEESVEEQMEVEVETFDVNAEDGISDVELAEDPDIDNLSPEVDEESVEEEVAEDDGLSDDVDLDAEDVDSIEVQESGADEVAL